jgi:hypothetical protein
MSAIIRPTVLAQVATGVNPCTTIVRFNQRPSAIKSPPALCASRAVLAKCCRKADKAPMAHRLARDRVQADQSLTSNRSKQMVEVKTHRDHPHSMAERIAKRERNSGDTAHADVVRKSNAQGSNYINIHHSRVTDYGEGNPGEGDIHGHKRGVV